MPHPKRPPVELLESGDVAQDLGVTAASVNAMVRRGEIAPFAVTRGRGVKLFTPEASLAVGQAREERRRARQAARSSR